MQPIDKFNPTNTNENHLNQVVERINILSKIKTSGGIMATVDNGGVMIWKKKEEATGDFPFANGRLMLLESLFTANELTLVKGTHDRKWLFVATSIWTADKTIIAAANPKAGDTYYFWINNDQQYNCWLMANTDQTIIMPSEDVTGADKISLDSMGYLYNGSGQLIMICSDTNTWSVWYTLASNIV